MDCLFCKIVQGEQPAKILYQDDQVVAFADVAPQAPQHNLIIPRKHIATLNDIDDSDTALLGHMIKVAKELANQLGIATDGYRLVLNCNRGAGQAVFHIHLHLLGGRNLTWPPG